MTDETPRPDPDHKSMLIHALKLALHQDHFVKLVLGKYRGDEADLERVTIRKLTVKGEPSLSFVYSYATKDVTSNCTPGKGMHIIGKLLGDSFKSAHLYSTSENLQLEFSRKGKSSLHASRPSITELPADSHNHGKTRFIDPAKPFLAALGVTDSTHNVIPSMSRKWKQINKFIEIFGHSVEEAYLSGKSPLHVVDFGSGKGYLTFAVHDYLANTLGVKPMVTGIEIREELADFCSAQAAALAAEGLTFQQGDMKSYTPGQVDILIALHACDTATDQAISIGITGRAGIIMCSPCCHKELRPQIVSPDVLKPMLRHGVHLGQEAEMITDTMRVLLLEANGYRTKLMEFVSLEHSGKNKLILAIKHQHKTGCEAAMEEYRKLKSFYGIRTHTLETLLQGAS